MPSAPLIVNLAEWSAHLMHRLEREAALTGDPELARLHEELAGYPGVVASRPEPTRVEGLVLPLRLRTPEGELAFFSTVSTFGTAVDLTLSELTIEAFYPANAETANRLLRDIA
jgi:hypothetical protein